MSEPRPIVAVRGSATRAAPPDSYALAVSVEARGPDAAAVNRDLAERFAEVDRALGAGSADVTVARGPLSVRRELRPSDGEPIAEWVARRSLTLTGTDPQRAGDVVGAVGELVERVTGLGIDGPSWRLDDDNAVYGQVQQDAVAEARRRAERYAAAVGGRLGRLVEVADAGTGGAVRMATYLSAPGGLGSMDFTPEPVEVSATVEARWLIEL